MHNPTKVAVDGSGNVYINDTSNGAIKEWVAASNAVTTLVSGLSNPFGLALDGATNVYYGFSVEIDQWQVAGNSAKTLISSLGGGGLDVAVDALNNVYIGEYGGVQKWTAATSNLTTIATAVFNPYGVAVDSGGNVFATSNYNNGNVAAILKWAAANQSLTNVISSGLASPVTGLAVDDTGNLYISDGWSNSVLELPNAYVDLTTRLEGSTAGGDALSAVVPATANLLPPFYPTNDQSWLTITGVTNGVVSFAFTANPGQYRRAFITLLGQKIPVIQAGALPLPYSLGATAAVEGPHAGLDSVVLSAISQVPYWTATANAPWLHILPGYQVGMGSTNIVFKFDANSGPTRTGTLTVGGQTLTITQAGSTYVASQPWAATVVPAIVSQPPYGGLYPTGISVDGSGNLYIADNYDGQIDKWTLASNSLSTLASTTANQLYGAAVDSSGNVFFASGAALKEWVAASNTVNTVVPSGLTYSDGYPDALAVDSMGNPYFCGFVSPAFAIEKWTAASNLVTTVFPTTYTAAAIAVDAAGNVYSIPEETGEVIEWMMANTNSTNLFVAGSGTERLAVDGGGNIYVADSFKGVEEWIAASNMLVTLTTTPSSCLAVDGSRNVYFYASPNMIMEEPHAFVDTTQKQEGAAGGYDVFPTVLPATENLQPPVGPTNSQPWVTITGATNGVVSFGFSANTGPGRSGYIVLFGWPIFVNQAGGFAPPVLTGSLSPDGSSFQFTFTNSDLNASFTALCTTNLSLPLSNWIVLGPATNVGGGMYQFSVPAVAEAPQLFYRISSP